MLGEPLRKFVDPLYARAADALAWRNVRPSRVVIMGFLLSIAAFPAIVMGHYIPALVLIAVGRSVDGLGSAARRQTIYCAAIPFAFALADPTRALAAGFFIFSFTVSAATFLAYSKIAAKRGIDVKVGGVKGVSHVAGLTDGAEAFIAFTIICIHPEWFGIVAYVFGVVCFVSAGLRFAAAFSDFPEQ